MAVVPAAPGAVAANVTAEAGSEHEHVDSRHVRADAAATAAAGRIVRRMRAGRWDGVSVSLCVSARV